jgi:anaerobic selenocysteine-containing dehydrogenase
VPFDDIVANGSHGTTTDPVDGWVHEQVLHDGRWNLAPRVLRDRLRTIGSSPDEPPSLVLVPRRQVRTVNATVYGTADPARVVVNPLDAADAKLADTADGGTIRVSTSAGSIEGKVKRDADIARGTVALTHGRGEVLVSTLISAVDAVDPLTGMPRASGVPVTLTASPAAPIET